MELCWERRSLWSYAQYSVHALPVAAGLLHDFLETTSQNSPFLHYDAPRTQAAGMNMDRLDYNLFASDGHLVHVLQPPFLWVASIAA